MLQPSVGDGPERAVGNAFQQDARSLDVEEVFACSFERWYDLFRDVTFKSVVIPLPEDFVEFLMADGIELPPEPGDDPDDSDDSDHGVKERDDDISSDGDGQGDCLKQIPSFAEVERAVSDGIAELGGAALVKLNWSAPKDARWLYGSMRCEKARDAITLLKASDFVAHDLCHCVDHCSGDVGQRKRPEKFVLVLREWCKFEEGGEFRCFVRGGRLLGISQRHTSAYFPFLADDDLQEALLKSISRFFEERVRGAFVLERYAFDVIVGKSPRYKVRLMDFSPWAGSTDPLLFDWEELNAATPPGAGVAAKPEMRVVHSEAECRGKLENYHALPLEVAELGAKTPEEIEALCRSAEEALGRQAKS